MTDDDTPKPPPRKRAPRKAPAKSNVVPIRSTGEDAAAAAPGRTRPNGRKPGTRQRGGHRTSQAAIRIAERRADVLQLRRMGLSFTKIAEAMSVKYEMPKYNRSDAHHDMTIGLDSIVEEPARELLAEELDRLSVATAALMPKVAAGDIAAIQALLRVMDRRAKYRGLDSPIKHDLSGTDVVSAALNLSDPVELHQAADKVYRALLTPAQRQAGGE